jgi:hypothetical protein|tara:strand:- start:8729 stop:8956 length:228 start_codon:yes stop_codon:yes gene_type:complete
MRGGGRAGEVINAVDLEHEGLTDIMADKLEVRIGKEVGDISFPAGKKVIKADDVVTLVKEALAEMGAEESSSACD